MTFEVAGDLPEDALNVFIQVNTNCIFQTLPCADVFVIIKLLVSTLFYKHTFYASPGSALGKDVQKQRRKAHDCHSLKGTVKNNSHSGSSSDQ